MKNQTDKKEITTTIRHHLWVQHHLTAVTLMSALLVGTGQVWADQALNPINQRYASAEVDEVPSFQRHVTPLLGRLGCNGRACHGSFQGQGGFRLSLFGYDFTADHEALLAGGDEPRVSVDDPADSLILTKPTSEFDHEGGQRYEKGGWEYRVLRRWIEGGAKHDAEAVRELAQLEVSPPEIVFQTASETTPLRVVAVWDDGSREDVTPLCRFQTNDPQVAKISAEGLVTAAEPGDTHVVVFYDNGVVPVPVIRPVTDRVGEDYPQVPTPTEVDRLVVARLRKLGLVPSELADDATFLRRVSLDVTGTLPAPREVEAFLADTSADKRERKIEELLASPGYAAWWTTRLCDFTGNNSDALRNASAVSGQADRDWYDWIHRRVAENMPYDEIVAGIVTATSRKPGQTYLDYSREMSAFYRGDDDATFADRETMPHYWARTNFRKPEERAIGFAYSFMGIRIQCAQCHKHPFDQWSKQDFDQFKALFGRVVAANGAAGSSRKEYTQMLGQLGLANKRGGELRREIQRLLQKGKSVPFPEVAVIPARSTNRGKSKSNKATGNTVAAKLLGGDQIDLAEYEDVREPLMQWLRSKNNRFFARSFVNRVWAGYFNAGIVDPPDDMSLANPPSNQPLLDYLATGFIDSGFDMKWVHRQIVRSRTYQLSWKPNDTNRLDQRNFSRAVPRRLPAEVAYDALRQATAADTMVEQMHRDPAGANRAIAIAGAGYRNRGGPAYALAVFGRSTRESNCDCDRSSDPSLLQTVFLQNDQEMLTMIDGRQNGWLQQVAKETGLRRQKTSAPGVAKPMSPEKYRQVRAGLTSASSN